MGVVWHLEYFNGKKNIFAKILIILGHWAKVHLIWIQDNLTLPGVSSVSNDIKFASSSNTSIEVSFVWIIVYSAGICVVMGTTGTLTLMVSVEGAATSVVST